MSGSEMLPWIYAFLMIVFGWLGVASLRRQLHRWLKQHLDVLGADLLSQMAYYSLGLLVLIVALQQIGFELSTLLGTAGILTIAVSFAAQNTVASVISGLFLRFERPFVVGDHIQMGGLAGKVISIDLMSTRLQNNAGHLIRIPNATLFKKEVINKTHFQGFSVDVTIKGSQDVYQWFLRHADDSLSQIPYVQMSPPPQLYLMAVDADLWTMRYRLWLAMPSQADTIMQDLHAIWAPQWQSSRLELPHLAILR